jgi:4-hydroxy-tetrahydrodipicolinate synthase
MTRLTGLFPVVPTPLRNGEIDTASITSLVATVAPFVDGLTVLGSSGESGYLSSSERQRALAAFVESAANESLPVIAGITDPSLDEARAFVAWPEAQGVAAFLLLPPTYYPTTLAATERQAAAIAETTDKPIVFYDIPSLTGLTCSPREILDLASSIRSIEYVKVASIDLERVREYCDAGELMLFAGYDEILHEQVAEGCGGAMVPVIAMCPEACRRWFDAIVPGRRAEAFAVYSEEIAPLCRAMVGADVDFIAVVKRVLAARGAIASDETVPGIPTLTPLRERQVDEAIAYLSERARTNVEAIR